MYICSGSPGLFNYFKVIESCLMKAYKAAGIYLQYTFRYIYSQKICFTKRIYRILNIFYNYFNIIFNKYIYIF